jgi:cysteine synthase A
VGKIYDSILELVGHTPIVRLHKLEQKYEIQGNLLAKLESFNPNASVKDRIALELIEAAEKEGKLKPGGTIVEGTSGNTGIGLASVAAAKGYKTIIVMPDNMSRERISILEGFGAQVILTPGELNMPGAGGKAAEIAAETEGSFVPMQGANSNNPAAHYKSTGPEIWEDTDGKVDLFVSAVGTGGTITGAGQFLKEKNPQIKIIAVEPEGCPVLSGGDAGPHKIQGIGGGIIPPVLNREIYDEIILVKDEDAFDIARSIALEEGISAGISSGAALWAALQLAKRPENQGKNIVALLADAGERYLSSGIYETKRG